MLYNKNGIDYNQIRINKSIKGAPEQYGPRQAQSHRWKRKNHKDDYTDLVSGFHPYTPISAP